MSAPDLYRGFQKAALYDPPKEEHQIGQARCIKRVISNAPDQLIDFDLRLVVLFYEGTTSIPFSKLDAEGLDFVADLEQHFFPESAQNRPKLSAT